MTAAPDELRRTSFRLLLGCFGGAFALAVAMAALSVMDSHPDEKFHLAAGHYYLDHWLPPQVDEGTLRSSLSGYGYTYLGDVDVSYFLAGKVARVAGSVIGSEYLCFRAFNLLLFAILIGVYAWRRDAFSPIVLALVTPQIWYVFSYFNNDALPLFLALLLADLLFGARARIGDALAGPWQARSLASLAGCGALLGLLVLTKSNYLPFLGFVAFLALWKAAGFAPAAIAVAGAGLYLAQARGFFPLPQSVAIASVACGAAAIAVATGLRARRTPALRTALLRAALVAFVALGFASPPLLYDRAVNGDKYTKNSALSALAEAHADPEYRPSTAQSDPESAFWGLRLRDKGVTLVEILLPPWSWGTKTWKSFTGYYGYMKLKSPFVYHAALFVVHLALAGWIVRTLFVAGAPSDPALLAVAGGFGGAIVLLSLYHSWVNDFQAQGRYLFPVLAIAAIPFARAALRFDARDMRIVRSLLAVAFLLSAFSFGFRGLGRIAKVTGG
jgi:hypothetical protein